MSSEGSPADTAAATVHSLVDAIREALACGIRCTDGSGGLVDSSEVDALCAQSERALACVQQIQESLISSLEQTEPEDECTDINLNRRVPDNVHDGRTLHCNKQEDPNFMCTSNLCSCRLGRVREEA